MSTKYCYSCFPIHKGDNATSFHDNPEQGSNTGKSKSASDWSEDQSSGDKGGSNLKDSLRTVTDSNRGEGGSNAWGVGREVLKGCFDNV